MPDQLNPHPKHTDVGSVERFIEAFNRYEAEADLFHLRDADGCPWWDLVRYRVQFALCIERAIYGRRSNPPASKFARARSFTHQSARLLRDIGRVRGPHAGQARNLLISTRSLSYMLEVLRADEGQERLALIVNDTGQANVPHVAVSKQSVDFFVRLAMYGQRLPSEVAEEAHRVAAHLQERFDSKADLFDIIALKYREHLAAQLAWSFVLDSAGALERIVYVNDDTLKSLVFLARARGILTEELQHGYMGQSHVAFSYPPMANAPETLPDKLIINRDTGDIVYPATQVVMAKAASVAGVTGSRDIDVLIGASPTLWNETAGIVGALVGQGLSLAVKLHPAQTEKSSGLRQRFSADEVAIHDGSEDFCALARRARVYVPANPTSTTTFEAVENGARLIVVDFGGVRKTAMNDGIASARVGSLQELLDAVFSQLT